MFSHMTFCSSGSNTIAFAHLFLNNKKTNLWEKEKENTKEKNGFLGCFPFFSFLFLCGRTKVSE